MYYCRMAADTWQMFHDYRQRVLVHIVTDSHITDMVVKVKCCRMTIYLWANWSQPVLIPTCLLSPITLIAGVKRSEGQTKLTCRRLLRKQYPHFCITPMVFHMCLPIEGKNFYNTHGYCFVVHIWVIPLKYGTDPWSSCADINISQQPAASQ